MATNKLTHKPRLVIFDMDGLMFDTEQVAFVALSRAMETYGKTITAQQYSMLAGAATKHFRASFAKMFPDIDTDAADDLALEYMTQIYRTDGIPIKKGLFELLDYLNDAGIMRTVATSTNRSLAREVLQRSGTEHYFHGFVFGDEIKHSKPAPDIFLAAANKLGIDPKDALVLEDSLNGVRSALAANIPVIMVPDMREPDEQLKQQLCARVDNLLQVRDFITAL